jgi:2-C-methyl-D-erythritol 4-phosphate cytidylyltransferase
MISAVIVAGGKGKRLGAGINKQYIKLLGREILAWTLGAFEKVALVEEVVLVVPEDELEYCRENIVNHYGFKKVKEIVTGGAERQNSVYNGLKACSPDTEVVLIHDGARPFISVEVIAASIEGAMEHGACAVAVAVKDTLKVVDREKFVVSTPERSSIYSVQTPQTFKYELILKAHRQALEKNMSATDDTMLVEALGRRVKLIEGDYYNLKITTQEDLVFGEAILKAIQKK